MTMYRMCLTNYTYMEISLISCQLISDTTTIIVGVVSLLVSIVIDYGLFTFVRNISNKVK